MEAVSKEDLEALYRAAVGHKKAGFYVPKFLKFDQPGGSRLSWNWPAFFVAFYWFLYRRMYVAWAIYSLLIPIGIAVLTTVVGHILGKPAATVFDLVVSIGYYFGVIPALANSLYHHEVKDRIAALREKVPETSAQLLVLDNTSPTNNFIWIIIVVVMIAMIGILAAIAIPAYQDYTIRAQVSEAFPLADQVETAVSEHYEANKSWAANIEELDFSQSPSGRYVSTLSVDRGTVTVTFGNQANYLIAKRRLSFRPMTSGTDTIIWKCGYKSDADSADIEVGANLTDIPQKFLPAKCR
jgi:Tfp pilus assembly major pilin PilA